MDNLRNSPAPDQGRSILRRGTANTNTPSSVSVRSLGFWLAVLLIATIPAVQLRETGTKIFELDYTDDSTIAHAAEKYGDQPLDCLVNCGGLHTDANKLVSSEVANIPLCRSGTPTYRLGCRRTRAAFGDVQHHGGGVSHSVTSSQM